MGVKHRIVVGGGSLAGFIWLRQVRV
jgi:hypothetical protein